MNQKAPPLIATIKPVDPATILQKMAETPELTAEQERVMEETYRKRAGQITFYPYDRGQCFDKREQAVMAFVNIPGACAHYLYSSATKTWEFVQLPHMSTERRCAERLGYRSVAAMQEALFEHFESYLMQIGWKEGVVVIDGREEGEAKSEGVLVLDGMGVLPGVLRDLPHGWIRPNAPLEGLSGEAVEEALEAYELSDADRAAMYGEADVLLAATEKLKQENKPGTWNIAALAGILKGWGRGSEKSQEQTNDN